MADDRRTVDQGRPSDPTFPSVSYEEVDWPGDTSQIPRSRRDRYTPTYEAAVTPAIAGLDDLHVDIQVVAAADEASQEIARFDAELGGELAPFAAVLLRSESAASSQIENLTASAKSIGLAELAETNRQNASLIVANVRTMHAALELADRLDETTIIEMHRQLLGASDPRIVGSWREQQVWIGGSRWGPQEATYVAPHHERVGAAMTDLVGFMNRDDLPVLIQTAVAHAQFETIHPFPDGNGRTGRALVHSMLRAKGVTRSVTVPISAGLLTDTAGYFAGLTAFREGDPNPIVSSMADAAFAATVNGRRLRDELDEIRANWDERIAARRDAAVWRITDHLLSQPVVTSQVLQDAVGASAPAVNAALDQLGSARIVSNLTGRSRNRVWVADDVIAALDAFAERAGRRG